MHALTRFATIVVLLLGAALSPEMASSGQTIDAIGLVADAWGRLCEATTRSDSKQKAAAMERLNTELSNLPGQLVKIGVVGPKTGTMEQREAALQGKISQITLRPQDCSQKMCDFLRENLIAAGDLVAGAAN